jgi:hypothetical protein
MVAHRHRPGASVGGGEAEYGVLPYLPRDRLGCEELIRLTPPQLRLLRRKSTLRNLAPLLWLPLLACGGSKPSNKEVAAALAVSSQFVPPKTALVWRELYAQTTPEMGGGALNDQLLGKIDGVLPILRANDLVAIEDQAVSDGNGGYMHLMRVKPTETGIATKAFHETDEQLPSDPYTRERRVPGWRLALANRELVRVVDVITPDNPLADKIAPGYVQANFEFKWIPTDVGVYFDMGSAGYDELSDQQQRAVKWAGSLDSRRVYAGRAWLRRDKEQKWIVTGINCMRCDK